MHSANVIHRDLKPSNILVNSNCDLKICDLGLSRGVDPDEESRDLTEYVVTRWYRAPEVMLACQRYSRAIDVWSAGCIFAELLIRKPLFPGEDYVDQLRIICSKLGKPQEDDLGFVRSDKARRFLSMLPCDETATTLPQLLQNANGEAVDLVDRMLKFCPERRCSVEEALHHPFMSALHEDETEPLADCSFEDKDLKLPEEGTRRSSSEEKELIKRLVWQEILAFHPSAPPTYPGPLSGAFAAAAAAEEEAFRDGADGASAATRRASSAAGDAPSSEASTASRDSPMEGMSDSDVAAPGVAASTAASASLALAVAAAAAAAAAAVAEAALPPVVPQGIATTAQARTLVEAKAPDLTGGTKRPALGTPEGRRDRFVAGADMSSGSALTPTRRSREDCREGDEGTPRKLRREVGLMPELSH